MKLFCGCLLLLTSGIEVFSSFGDGSIGVHHGIFVFGLIQILQSIPDIQEGLADFEEAEETFNNKS